MKERIYSMNKRTRVEQKFLLIVNYVGIAQDENLFIYTKFVQQKNLVLDFLRIMCAVLDQKLTFKPQKYSS